MPSAPESLVSESESPETKGGPESMGYVDNPEIRSAISHKSTPDVHSTTLVMDGENPLLSENIHHSTMPPSLNREQTESPPVPEEDIAEGVPFLDTVQQMVDIVHLLKKHPNDLPRTVHKGSCKVFTVIGAQSSTHQSVNGLMGGCGWRFWREDPPQIVGVPYSTRWSISAPQSGTTTRLNWQSVQYVPKRKKLWVIREQQHMC
jgi:hypothetical protein